MRVVEGKARNCLWKLAVNSDGTVSLVLKLTRADLRPDKDRVQFRALSIDEPTELKVLCDGQWVRLKFKCEIFAELSGIQIKNRQLQVATIRIPVDAGPRTPEFIKG